MRPVHSCIGPDDDMKLWDEHVRLSRQFEKIIQLTATNDPSTWEPLFAGFAHELEEHMQYEEDLLFPAFERSGLAKDIHTDRLRPEHEDIRVHCRALISERLKPALLIERLRELERTLLEHKERERLVLYPWLTSLRCLASFWKETPQSLPCRSIASPQPFSGKFRA